MSVLFRRIACSESFLVTSVLHLTRKRCQCKQLATTVPMKYFVHNTMEGRHDLSADVEDDWNNSDIQCFCSIDTRSFSGCQVSAMKYMYCFRLCCLRDRGGLLLYYSQPAKNPPRPFWGIEMVGGGARTSAESGGEMTGMFDNGAIAVYQREKVAHLEP